MGCHALLQGIFPTQTSPIVSLTFMIISSVFPWTTASGLMMAKVHAFSDDTATSQGWCCQTLDSQEALRTPSSGTVQLHTAPASLPQPLGGDSADLDSSGCRGLAPDPNPSLAARDTNWEGECGEGEEDGRWRRKSKMTQEQNPETTKSAWRGTELEQR